jgi:hypothetical protein
MTSGRPGSFQLSSQAYVENARTITGKPHSVVLDVYLLGAPDQENDEIVCSLRYFKGEESLLITEGLYDIVATVTFFSYCISN